MEFMNRISNLQEYAVSNMQQYFEMFVYTGASFFIPIFMGHPQIAVGIIVNALLIIAALNLKGYKLLPVIIAPSLGALSRCVLFGPFTIFLLYMAPFIWIGNAILVYSFKLFNLHLKKNYIFTLFVGSGLKAGFLFLSAFILYKIGLVPAAFLTAFGIMQMVTALFGGAAAYGFQSAKKNLVK